MDEQDKQDIIDGVIAGLVGVDSPFAVVLLGDVAIDADATPYPTVTYSLAGSSASPIVFETDDPVAGTWRRRKP
jgi:hypothetical protein